MPTITYQLPAIGQPVVYLNANGTYVMNQVWYNFLASMATSDNSTDALEIESVAARDFLLMGA